MARMKKGGDRLAAAVEELRKTFLGYPETAEDFPWGHRAIKVRGKIFATLVLDDDGLRTSMKLRDSNLDALALPFTEPTHYGMGKHGWVTARFAIGDTVPVELLKAWGDESYRLVAPKTLVKRLSAP